MVLLYRMQDVGFKVSSLGWRLKGLELIELQLTC